MEKIDFVVTWVDGNDLKWRKEKERFEKENNIYKGLNSEERYREWGFMRYWFRAVEQYAPWVNKIFFITEGHVPDWLDLDNEKLVHVKHSDYIDSCYLPTFNSNVIEMNLLNLEDLSEHFVLFNDDTFINENVKPSDFFKDGLPSDVGIFGPLIPKKNTLTPIVLNNMEIINEHFSKRELLKNNFRKYFSLKYREHLLKNLFLMPWKDILGFYDYHIPVSYNKSTFGKVFDKEKQAFLDTFNNKFRKKNEINHWLIRYWQLASGNFSPRDINFGKNFAISDDPSDIVKEVVFPKHKIICINDGVAITDFENIRDQIIDAFEKKFPSKSQFEKGS